MSALHPFHDPKHINYVDASRWCITREDLDFFEKEVRELWKQGKITDDPNYPNKDHDDPLVGPTMYRVNECYIKPKTAEAGGMSWALMRHPGGLQCEAFATHAWIEGVFEFLTRVRSSWPPDAKHLYICFLANPQNGDISALLSCDVLESPFAKALNSDTCKYMLVIPNRHLSIYLRLWCVLEAYLAIKATEDRGLIIKMPVAVNRLFWVELMFPGVALLITGFALGHGVLNSTLGVYFGPLMWQLAAHVACTAIESTFRCLKTCVGCKVRRAALFDVIISTLDLFIVGVASGVSAWQALQFKTRDHYKDLSDHQEPITIQRGEYAPLAVTTLSIIVMHIYDIVLAINSAVLKLEDAKLQFRTVRLAECSSPDDERSIKMALGHMAAMRSISRDAFQKVDSGDAFHKAVAMIDDAILQLKSVGRYDRDVNYNLNKGMCEDCIKEGINPFKVVCAFCLWTFYWVTDLTAAFENVSEASLGYETSADTHIAIAVQMFAAFVCLGVVYWIGERAIFAVVTAFWFGFFFACVSMLDYYWHDLFKIHGSMSRATAGLQCCVLLAMLMVDVYFYAGFHASQCDGNCSTSDRRIVDSFDVDDDLGQMLPHCEMLPHHRIRQDEGFVRATNWGSSTRHYGSFGSSPV